MVRLPLNTPFYRGTFFPYFKILKINWSSQGQHQFITSSVHESSHHPHPSHFVFKKKVKMKLLRILKDCVYGTSVASCSEVVPFVLRMDKPIFSSLLTDRWFYDITILRFCSTCTRHVQTINLDKWSHHNACCHIHRGQAFTRFSTGNVYNSPSSAASRSIVSSSSSSSSST